MRAPIALRSAALYEPARLEAVEQANQARPLDAQRLRKGRLAQPGIRFDHEQHRILGRANVELRQRANEVLEDPQLGTPDEVTEVPGQASQVGASRSHARRA